ncbi:helix-turn-helix domain-containing protein [Streptomyces sp. MA5143a]|uniref:helix-turn-helix domain-containing protein n=1 Tax=Streptomyces sp. MA5143a TaxID=2083010 RepID=UPI0035C1C390
MLAARGGSTRRVATMLGVSQRTVQRWVTKKPGARRPPGPDAGSGDRGSSPGSVAAPGTGTPACPG